MAHFWGIQPRDAEDLPDATQRMLREMGPDACVAASMQYLEDREAVLGANHPELGLNLYNVAKLLDALARYEEAEPLFRRSLAITETALGPDQYEVATVLNSLATLLETESRYEEAEPLYRRCIAIYEAAFGPEHPSVGACSHNLAGLLWTLARDKEAGALYRRSLAISRANYGAFHPDSILTLITLVVLRLRLRPRRPSQEAKTEIGASSREPVSRSSVGGRTMGSVIGESPGEPILMQARPYTVEPGFPECGHILAEHNGGGLGSANPRARYFAFLDNDRSPLADFLETMTPAGNVGDHVSYCTSSVGDIDAFVGRYLSTFLSATRFGDSVIEEIQEHLRSFPMRSEYLKRETYRENMVMHTEFFQDFYYDTAHVVASELIPSELLENCFSAFGLPPGWTAGTPGRADEFVERLSSNPKYRFYTDAPDSSFRAVFGANRMDDFVSGPAFHCSRHDYENFIRPYILFLSNWSLVLGVYLCTRVFGQCAFVVCWETTNGVDLNMLRGR